MSGTNASRATQILARLKTLAAELSGYDEDELIENRTFIELGFDSLFLTQVASAFQNAFGVKITFRQLFDELPSLAALAAHIDQSLPPEAAPAPQASVPQATSSASAPLPAGPPSVAVPQDLASLGAPVAPDASLAPAGSVQFDFPAVSPARQANVGGLQAILGEQLELMHQQLRLLAAARGGVPMPAAAPAAPGVPAAPAALTAASPTPPSALKALPSAAASDTTEPEPPAEKVKLPEGFVPQVDADMKTVGPRKQAHLDRLIARYTAKTRRSKAHTQQYRPYHADPRTASGFNRLWKEMSYPVVIEGSSGAQLTDLDGNTYIDILNGFGPNYLGHSPPFVSEALKEQIEKGIEVGPQTPIAGEAAKLFCEMTGMDRVSWVNTGSEAVQAAIRIARTCTGRDKIVMFSGDYHGNFDEVLVRATKSAKGRRSVPLAPGIPLRAVSDVIVLDYGDMAGLEVIKQNAGQIAAVLVEPVQSRRPELQPREFLHALRALTEQEEIVLVFDEVITGFRMCPGGAQEFYGVRADLATYGKIIGGGMPIGVVAGKSRFMDTFDGGMWQYGDDSFPAAGVTFFAGTFVRHPLAIAAVLATLKYLKAAGPALQDSVNRKTSRVAGELNQFLRERGVKITIPHCASQMFIRVEEESELAPLLFWHLRDRGIHVLNGYPSYMTVAHTDEDVERIIAAFKDAILEMQDDGILPRPSGETTLPGNWRRRMPLTDAQREVWVAAQMSEDASCAFNESDSIHIEGPLDVALWRQATIETLEAHEAFRLRFDDDGATQWVDPTAQFEMPLVELSGSDIKASKTQLEQRLATEALTPFDLEAGPLVRVKLYSMGPRTHVFTIHCHHLVFDGYSSELVVREIVERYGALKGGRAPGLDATVPFSHYVAASARRQGDEAFDTAFAYWLQVFGDELPMPLELPSDRPRAAARTHRGSTFHRVLDADLSTALREVGKACGVSQHALLLSSFSTLMSRLSVQEDLVVGVPAAGQARHGLETVGYCVNALPIRTFPRHDAPFRSFAAETQKAVLDAFEHQDVGLGELIRALQVPRDPSRMPLVEVIFNYSRYFAGLDVPDCTVTSRENRREAVHYDLFFNIVEAGGRLVIDWDYSTELFDAETIERWVEHYVHLLGGIVKDPSCRIGDLPLMSDQETQAILANWSRN